MTTWHYSNKSKRIPGDRESGLEGTGGWIRRVGRRRVLGLKIKFKLRKLRVLTKVKVKGGSYFTGRPLGDTEAVKRIGSPGGKNL